MQFKVVSFNIWDLPLFFVRNRKERIAALPAYLKSLDADIICLQESFDPQHRVFLKNAMGSDYHMAGGDGGGRRRFLMKNFDDTGGLVIFSKYPVIKNEFTPHNRLVHFALGEFLGRKGCLTATVRTPVGDMEIINTHLHEETPFRVDRAVRRHQLAGILRHVNDTQLPAVLVGDFNQDALNHQEDFAELFETTGFSHPLNPHSDHKPSFRPENPYVERWKNRTRGPKRFDYMLVRNLKHAGLSATYYEPQILPIPLSNHDPLLLTLSHTAT
ncbi:MAG: endonuclease/exonuclease/phosphatase family protein [bacterium]|nr:endonuclease/exonuclease/phosphatase family protein [bacterium]